jgi:peroxiredoxin
MPGLRSIFARSDGLTPVFYLFPFLMIAWGIARGEELPRYKLKVGQELVYRTVDPPRVSEEKDRGKTIWTSGYEWIFCVVRQNENGSWRLVFREQFDDTFSFMEGKERKERRVAWSKDGYCDLWPDGRMADNPTIQPQTDPTVLFPVLPPDLQTMGTSWEAKLSLDDTRCKLRPAAKDSPAEGAVWRFVEEREGMLDAIYLSSTHRDYVFDRAEGVVRKVTTVSKEAWPAGREAYPATQSFELASTRQHNAADLQALREETDCYWAAMEEYKKLAGRASQDAAHAAEWLDKAEAGLKQLAGQLTLPPVRTMVDRKLEEHQQDRSSVISEAEKTAKLMNKPAPDWKTADLDGRERALTDYRGKVVVLDFWHRGCGWCIRAMPQLKQLADEFEGKAVAILGINSDEDESDARFVIDALKLNYATLKNSHGDDRISAQYKVQAWPTLIVIDRQGVVRRVDVGYTLTLRHDLGDRIRELLAEKDR